MATSRSYYSGFEVLASFPELFYFSYIFYSFIPFKNDSVIFYPAFLCVYSGKRFSVNSIVNVDELEQSRILFTLLWNHEEEMKSQLLSTENLALRIKEEYSLPAKITMWLKISAI